jgi:hypothetical protein
MQAKPCAFSILPIEGIINSNNYRIVKRDGLNKFTEAYDKAGKAIWTKDDILAETIYRFKG